MAGGKASRVRCYFHIRRCFDVSRRRRSLKERLRHKGVFRHERRPPVSAGRGVEFSRATLAKGKISPEYSASENVHYSFDVAENGRGRASGEKSFRRSNLLLEEGMIDRGECG